jgi:class 3 adenylate cyclase
VLVLIQYHSDGIILKGGDHGCNLHKRRKSWATRLMVDKKAFIKLRVFLSAPSDLTQEKNVVEKAIKMFNTPNGISDKAGVSLELVRWEDYIRQYVHKPKSKIIKSIAISPWEIFIGIIWKRFASFDITSSEDEIDIRLESGTKEQFELVKSINEKYEKPTLLFFQCVRPEFIEDIDPEKLIEVNNFFGNLSSECVFKFSNIDQFESQLIGNLMDNLRNLPDDIKRIHRDAKSEVFSTDSEDRQPGHAHSEVEAKGRLAELESGEAYEVAFLSIDIVDHSRIVEKSEPQVMQILLNNFLKYIQRIAREHRGEVFSWSGDGGILMFWGKDYLQQSILSGLSIQNGLLSFNCNKSQNPLDEYIEIRVAGHRGIIIFSIPLNTMSSAVLNFASHLEKKGTYPGEFCVTQSMLSDVDEKIQRLFSYKDRFRGEPCYSYKSVSDDKMFSEERMSDLLRQLDEKRDELMNLSDEDSENEKSIDFEYCYKRLSVLIDDIYSPLERFIDSFKYIDDRWSSKYLNQTLLFSKELSELEDKIWKIVKKLGVSQQGNSEYESITIVGTWASRRAKPVALLGLMEERITSKMKGQNYRPGTGEVNRKDAGVIKRKIGEFNRADELDEEITLTNLLLFHKQYMIDLIHNDDENIVSILPINKFWKLADQVLQDDLYSFEYRRMNDRKLSDTLADKPVFDKRFALLRILLGQREIVDIVKVESLFSQKYQEMDDVRENFDLIWRCLLVGHPDEKTRRYSANQLSFVSIDPLSLGAVGKMISRNNIPVDSLLYIGQRIEREGSEEEQRLFFDCTRSRIEEAIQSAREKTAIRTIAKIIQMYARFSFLVEDLYFDRFEKLLRIFIERARDMNVTTEKLGALFADIGRQRNTQNKPKGKLPSELRRRPPWIQKKLAGEKPYIYHFVSHPDDRIALETYRNINLGNVERVLNIPEINDRLLDKILESPPHLNRANAKVAALIHPKCKETYARRYIETFSRNRRDGKALKDIMKRAKKGAIRNMAIARMRQLGIINS